MYVFTDIHLYIHTCVHVYIHIFILMHTYLVEKGGRKAVLETLHTHQKKMSKKTDIHESKEKIRAHRASSKATGLFLTK